MKDLLSFSELTQEVQEKILQIELDKEDWTWAIEDIEHRIENEAIATKIKNFYLSRRFSSTKNTHHLGFSGSLSLIDVVETIYSLSDKSFHMYEECKTIVRLSQQKLVKVKFFIHTEQVKDEFKTRIDHSLERIKSDKSVSPDDYKKIQSFLAHASLMLDIWKNVLLKRWKNYFDIETETKLRKDILTSKLKNLGKVYSANGNLH